MLEPWPRVLEKKKISKVLIDCFLSLSLSPFVTPILCFLSSLNNMTLLLDLESSIQAHANR